MHRVHWSIAYVIFGVALWYLAASSSCFEIKHSGTMKNSVKNASSVPKKFPERGRSIARCSTNALTVSCDRYERPARARNFRASFRLTSSRTGKIYEKNACQREDGIYENSRFAPVRPVGSPSCPPSPPPLTTTPRSRGTIPLRRAPSSLFLVHPFPSRGTWCAGISRKYIDLWCTFCDTLRRIFYGTCV